ncbi:MAG: hypothetical protein C4567_13255 [Deltaproteobacteria bacterium]|nr:MAG: hypothetical protein C4567_13255 [Deltaproteobacteria bacterium]
MEYAWQILHRFGPAPGKPSRNLRFVNEVTCAYCRGAGSDPQYSSASGCPVCRGAGRVGVVPPVMVCRRCGGSGRVGGDLICLTCKGIGMVPVAPGAGPCPRCGGTGAEGIFYCHVCKGQGIA